MYHVSKFVNVKYFVRWYCYVPAESPLEPLQIIFEHFITHWWFWIHKKGVKRGQQRYTRYQQKENDGVKMHTQLQRRTLTISQISVPSQGRMAAVDSRMQWENHCAIRQAVTNKPIMINAKIKSFHTHFEEEISFLMRREKRIENCYLLPFTTLVIATKMFWATLYDRQKIEDVRLAALTSPRCIKAFWDHNDIQYFVCQCVQQPAPKMAVPTLCTSAYIRVEIFSNHMSEIQMIITSHLLVCSVHYRLWRLCRSLPNTKCTFYDLLWSQNSYPGHHPPVSATNGNKSCSACPRSSAGSCFKQPCSFVSELSGSSIDLTRPTLPSSSYIARDCRESSNMSQTCHIMKYS